MQNATGLPQTNFFEISTTMGTMVIELYDDTPIHRDNFKKLASEGFFDGTTFHRVIGGFMIQGGDPNSKDDDPNNNGNGGPGYTLPAEIVSERYHKRGALASARLGDNMNPERESSGSQFYIVHGSIYPGEFLDQLQSRAQQMIPDSTFEFSDEARRIYMDEGGAPMLDGMYTVFGELVEGFEVMDRITRVLTPNRAGQRGNPNTGDMPLLDIAMQVRPLPGYQN
ncbi:MAG: peptidylprolyl isomerase [Bacteroidetes bacterium]|nr:peptidylprolyl isomerase [Bacteroidota bacterium]MCY4204128.1 peptidylprolyl isomerase [Bacteroidota bacterium]